MIPRVRLSAAYSKIKWVSPQPCLPCAPADDSLRLTPSREGAGGSERFRSWAQFADQDAQVLDFVTLIAALHILQQPSRGPPRARHASPGYEAADTHFRA